MKRRILKCVLIALLALGDVSAEVKSAVYLPAVSSADQLSPPDRMVDGSGLSDPLMALEGATLSELLPLTHQFSNTYLSSWVTNAPAADYFSAAPAPVLVFDLGSDEFISSMVFWQYENNGAGPTRTGNAARTIELRFALDAEGTNFPAAAWITMNLKNIDLDLGGVNSAQVLSAGVRARYVQLRVTDNYFGQPGITAGGDRVGIGEVRFNVATGSGRTAMAGAPNQFELRAATEAVPTMTSIKAGINPWGLALDAEGERVIWTDPVTNQVGWSGFGSKAGQDGVLFAPPNRVLHGIDLDCESGKLYLLDSKLDALLSFDLATQLLTTLVTGPFVRPNAIDHDPEDGFLAITDSGVDAIFLYNSAGVLQSSFANPVVTQGVWGVACDPLSEAVFFTSHDLGTLNRWMPSAGLVTVVASGLDRPRGVEMDRFGRIYCLLSGSGEVVEIDRDSGAVMVTALGIAPGGRDLVIFDADDADGDALLDWWELQNGHDLCDLLAGSDPDFDAMSALEEMLFNGSTTLGEANGGSVGQSVAPGVTTFYFETLSDEAYAYQLMLSDDLINWRRAVVAAELGSMLGGDYQSRTYSVDPVLEGFDPTKRLFGRMDGELISP